MKISDNYSGFISALHCKNIIVKTNVLFGRGFLLHCSWLFLNFIEHNNYNNFEIISEHFGPKAFFSYRPMGQKVLLLLL